MNSSNEHIDYWIACSGGVDSVVLVRLFKELNKNFGILHCNFKLRGVESDKDETFVRNLADEINVSIQVKNFDVYSYIKKKGGNTQLAARNLRYKWFEEVSSKHNSKIVLGHHKDDQVETFLLQLRRGGKLKGLSCMPFLKESYVRPLLNYTKNEIYELARHNSWLWREDSSNKKSDYFRNFYRNQLIPNFEKNEILITEIIKLVEDFQIILKYAENYLNECFEFSNNAKISFELWDIWPYWIKHLFLSKFSLTPLSVKEVERLKGAQKGKFLKNELSTIWNEGNYFFVQSNTQSRSFSEYEIELIQVSAINYKSGDVFIDKDKVKGQISFREWIEGDAFYPLGMAGQKKVSKFLRDRKVPSSEKRRYPVIVDESDQVIGIAGMCPDERYKLNNKTKFVYRISKKLISSN